MAVEAASIAGVLADNLGVRLVAARGGKEIAPLPETSALRGLLGLREAFSSWWAELGRASSKCRAFSYRETSQAVICISRIFASRRVNVKVEGPV